MSGSPDAVGGKPRKRERAEEAAGLTLEAVRAMKTGQLRQELLKRDLPVHGVRHLLIQRLEASMNDAEGEAPASSIQGSNAATVNDP